MLLINTLLDQIHTGWAAVFLPLVFAALAYGLRGVNLSGAVAGWIVSFILYAGAGPRIFAVLILVFFLTWAATKLGYQHKQRLGTAEKKGGRTGSQVMANVGLAAICASAYFLSHENPLFLLALIATLTEVTVDTVSSELGQAFSDTARLITNWKKVPAGTNGAISLVGTLGGISGAVVISAACVFLGLLHWIETFLLVFAAVFGMAFDSYLGATLERRGFLNNNAVNFIGTLSAALIVGAFYMLSHG